MFCLDCLTRARSIACEEGSKDICPCCRTYLIKTDRKQGADCSRWEKEGLAKLLKEAPPSVLLAWNGRGLGAGNGAAPPQEAAGPVREEPLLRPPEAV